MQDNVRTTLPRHFSAAQTARSHVRALCASMPVYVSATAELLTSELVANAVVHSEGAIALVMSVTGGVLLVEVSDESSDPPQLSPPGSEDTTGRGLRFVDTYALAWGATSRPGVPGKSVWFTLRTA